ncbi:hypothetical protein T07_12626 [Trichinella nelsoni]|uniref:Uncharacterized protein n=1 Tax=Trichinella nelsoni TaxID=6336 RepID=A0A0V0SF29_9BILA|nr:hypothetical protein T07_12626 [Trichinella nelsoni]
MDNDLMLNNRLKECGTEKIVTLKDVTQQLTTFIWKIIRHHCFRRNDTDGWRIPLKFDSARRIDAVAILKFPEA